MNTFCQWWIVNGGSAMQTYKDWLYDWLASGDVFVDLTQFKPPPGLQRYSKVLLDAGEQYYQGVKVKDLFWKLEEPVPCKKEQPKLLGYTGSGASGAENPS